MRRGALRGSLTALLLCGVAFGCDEEPASTAPTQIIVVVDAQDGVRAATSELAMVVRARSDGGDSVNETLRVEDGTLEWPWVLALTPKDDDASREFEVTATARDADGLFVAQARAISHFVKGDKRTLTLMLEDACIGVRGCEAEQTCKQGECTSAVVDPNALPRYDADAIPEPFVVGPLDRDAGQDAGPTPPLAPVDAGRDAEAPEDGAVSDAQVDPGCRANPDLDDEVCPQICPESCNGQDDDCDRHIDEDEAQDDCEDLRHALGACTKGKCVVTQCQNAFKDCDEDAVTGCESGPDDVEHCGSCNNPCSFPNMEASCVDNVCTPGACIGLFDDCDESDNSCETPLTTLTDCRQCGVPCDAVDNAEPSCETGTCGPGLCLGNFGDCNSVPGDGCEEPLNSATHCGDCGLPCDFPGSVEECDSGSCLATGCEAEYDDCDLDPSDGCESLSSADHCGGCGKTCDDTLMNVASASCDTGVCVPMCDAGSGFGNCDLDPLNGCESSVLTRDRCGDCDTTCEPLNAVGDCESGECELVRCEDGYDDCDVDGLDCEQSLDDPEHCGACDNDCTLTAKIFCSGGACTSADCDPGAADCDDTGSCSYDVTTDQDNCGLCDNACNFSVSMAEAHAGARPACLSSVCVPQCEPGYGDCNGLYEDGCETDLHTLTDCGGCGDGCSIANADEICTTNGDCEVDLCDDGWDDCDSDRESCETPLDTAADCGSCGTTCELSNAVPTCDESSGTYACEIATCTQAYFLDCDGMDDTGCEVDSRSDTMDCGSCGNDCSDDPNVAAAHCESSACVLDDCTTGFDDCTHAIPGCETTLGASPNCGSCGDDCSELPNTTATACVGLACAITSCEAGFESCDDSDANGCETDVFDVANCGGCASDDDNEPCSNLPNVAASSCAAGTCAIDSCAAGWVSCDGDVANGCEQSLTTVGPCFPDMNCTKHLFQGRSYFLCTNDRAWPGAIDRCNDLVGASLVRIDSEEENAFVAGLLASPAWIGATDVATADEWSWIDDLGNPTLFWKGAADGELQPGMYAAWLTSVEPNGSGNCAGIAMNGVWGDDLCTAQRDFVCEVQPDLCPLDEDKTLPGQCGCGEPDDDDDDDGTADCNDQCPSDPNKVEPGQCDCGTLETDSDFDGVADCDDPCLNDPTKIDPGACGCNVPDDDTDEDGTADCNDGCPYVTGIGPSPCRYPYTPSNFDEGSVNFGSALDVVLDCTETVVIDTDGAVSFPKWCGDEPVPEIVLQLDDSEAVVVPMRSLHLGPDTTLRVKGSRPLILAVAGDALIEGWLDGHTVGNVNFGAGSMSTCKGGDGDDGASAGLALTSGGGGGGGGAYGTGGGNGGTGAGGIAGGSAGVVGGGDDLVPLRGGCPGGNGGVGGGAGGGGGAHGGGGGAIQLSVAGLLQISASGAISTSGGGGSVSGSGSDGGGGGGSGGAVLLEGAVVQLASEAFVTANGGGAGSGTNTLGGGNPGSDGYLLNNLRAPGGLGSAGGGNGGPGAAARGPSGGGAAGTTKGGGGGGGGGVGRVRVNGLLACTLAATFSPEPATTCP